VKEQAEKLVVLHLRVPPDDYAALKQAAARSFRSANKEVLYRLRRSLTAEATAEATKP
jgi:hypothetical protein